VEPEKGILAVVLPVGEFGVLYDPLTGSFYDFGLDICVVIVVGLGGEPV
jgi:hypothetical protein